ncbi:3'(2'),5'-bisphosphate nucleotidase [hydrothermal vent metagenome]|uniref:3'-phosphoadenosine 5'-phosphate phosphatase n=1 Tax=hydrothermal vent metagenome TaxID=652676 RepID=A0A3B0TZU6_9ZZZZ
MSNEMVDLMIAAALDAGQAIMEIYAEAIEVTDKADGSPVTKADQRAEEIILKYLAKTLIPVLAEESVAAGRIPELGERFFVVDPLDGTKEFIKRNGQFTVNIALVENKTPILGVVLAPDLDQLFIGSAKGAFEAKTKGKQVFSRKKITTNISEPMNVVASRSHGHKALEPFCAAFNINENVSVGSSLKFCLLARGEACLYPRFTPTCEWDTAAGQAVLQAAGGAVYAISGQKLEYGKKDKDFFNPYFAAAASDKLAKSAAERMRALISMQEQPT